MTTTGRRSLLGRRRNHGSPHQRRSVRRRARRDGARRVLGFLVAGESPRYCADFARTSLADDDLPWVEKDGFAFGQYAIDTQLARELAASMIDVKGFDPAPFSARIADLFESGMALSAGKATTRAARRLASGMVWAQSGEAAPAAGNGGAIRAVPIGLSFKDPDKRSGAAALQAEVTHHDERVQAAAQLVAEAVWLAATAPDMPRRTFLDQIVATVEPLDPRLANGARTLERVLGQPADKAASMLCQAGHNPDDGYPTTTAISGFATPSTLFVLQAYLRAPDDLLKVLELALSGGGDVASCGAFAGALVGARLGLSGLGPRLAGWAAQLNDRGEDGRDHLVDLGRRLVDRKRR
ncbi:MAG: ADP-ribosylglycohydrolase family protein [Myxococcota bacterium]